MPTDYELVHGIDLVDVGRFRRWLEDPQASLSERFTEIELEYADDAHRGEHLAGCFAAKEACLKALGLGAGDGIPLTDIELFHGAGGAPRLRLTGRANESRLRAAIEGLVVSLSHGGGFAVASVVGFRGRSGRPDHHS